ncbi:MAG: hypothetical protein C4K58_02885 [Flavobacteriaceae bacterium]|nr:MAG: hypothetical protein C4K58_02885 [Flavobacteriaceae bacterium]
MLIFSLLNIYRGYQGFSPSSRLFEYHWYPYSTIFFGLVCLISVFLVYNFRKIGVYLMVLALFLDIVQQPQFGMMGTITSVFSLFVFIGYGLMVIIPRWAMFK